jgi:hypothetical protein
MLDKLIGTKVGNQTALGVAALTGIILVIFVDNTRAGVITFLAITTAESGLFSLIYGLRSTWRKADAARAVFWAVLAYFGVAAHALTLYLWPKRWWWSDDLREMLYLGLSLAGLNLVLTMMRVLGPPRKR